MRSIKFLLGFTTLAFLTACSPKLQLRQTDKQLYNINATIPSDSAIQAFIFPYKNKLDSIMNDLVGVSAIEITKNRPEGTLNNFFADAMFDSGKDQGLDFDFAYSNYGGLRTPLPKGEIYRYKIYELMPFENAFALVTFKGEDTQAFFDFIAASGGEPISGASFTIHNKKAVDIFINGQPFNKRKTYKILTSDYMANGGDGGLIFSKSITNTPLNYKLRDALFHYLEKKQKAGEILNPVIDGRIKIK